MTKISGITNEETTSISDGDLFEGEESGGNSFKTAFSVIKSTLKTYFDGLYLGQGNVDFEVKPDDETINNQGIQDDDDLTFTCPANAVRWLKLFLIFETVGGAGADDCEVGWDVPSGCTGYYGTPGLAFSNAAGLGATGTPVANQTISTDMTINMTGGGGAGAIVTCTIEALLINGSNEDTVTFRWGQKTPAGRDFTLKEGSSMEIGKVSG